MNIYLTIYLLLHCVIAYNALVYAAKHENPSAVQSLQQGEDLLGESVIKGSSPNVAESEQSSPDPVPWSTMLASPHASGRLALYLVFLALVLLDAHALLILEQWILNLLYCKGKEMVQAILSICILASLAARPYLPPKNVGTWVDGLVIELFKLYHMAITLLSIFYLAFGSLYVSKTELKHEQAMRSLLHRDGLVGMLVLVPAFALIFFISILVTAGPPFVSSPCHISGITVEFYFYDWLPWFMPLIQCFCLICSAGRKMPEMSRCEWRRLFQ